MENSFMGHVSVNGRIYEIFLGNIGQEDEFLTVNGQICHSFSSEQEKIWIDKKSLWIENAMVHFINIHGKVSVKTETLSDGITDALAQLKIPVFDGDFSVISESASYLRNTPEERDFLARRKLGTFLGCVGIVSYWISLLTLNADECKTIFFWIVVSMVFLEIVDIFIEVKNVPLGRRG